MGWHGIEKQALCDIVYTKFKYDKILREKYISHDFSLHCGIWVFRGAIGCTMFDSLNYLKVIIIAGNSQYYGMVVIILCSDVASYNSVRITHVKDITQLSLFSQPFKYNFEKSHE